MMKVMGDKGGSDGFHLPLSHVLDIVNSVTQSIPDCEFIFTHNSCRRCGNDLSRTRSVEDGGRGPGRGENNYRNCFLNKFDGEYRTTVERLFEFFDSMKGEPITMFDLYNLLQDKGMLLMFKQDSRQEKRVEILRDLQRNIIMEEIKEHLKDTVKKKYVVDWLVDSKILKDNQQETLTNKAILDALGGEFDHESFISTINLGLFQTTF